MSLDPSGVLHTQESHTALGREGMALDPPPPGALHTRASSVLPEHACSLSASASPVEPQSKTMTLANQLTSPPKLTVAFLAMPGLGMTLRSYSTTSFTS